MARVGVALFLPGNTEWLAREAARDDIHDSTPRPAVEGGNAIPDRKRGKGAVLLTRDQDCGGRGFPFHANDSPVGISEGQV